MRDHARARDNGVYVRTYSALCTYIYRDSVKAGLWTLDWTMDWTLDHILDWNMDYTLDIIIAPVLQLYAGTVSCLFELLPS